MHRTIDTARTAPRCLAQTRKKTPCRSPAIRHKRRCRMHGGQYSGAPRGNQYAMKHGRFTARAMAQRREARAVQQRVRTLTLLARYGIGSLEEFAALVQAQGAPRGG